MKKHLLLSSGPLLQCIIFFLYTCACPIHATGQSSILVSKFNRTISTTKYYETSQRLIAAIYNEDRPNHSGWAVTGIALDPGTSLADTLYSSVCQKILDFYYDVNTNSVAFTATTEKLKPLLQTIGMSTPDTIGDFFYSAFDEKGFIGFADREGRSWYKKFDGQSFEIPFGDNGWLGRFNARGVSVIKDASGQYLYDLANRRQIPGSLAESLYAFKDDVFIAEKNSSSSIIVLDNSNAVIELAVNEIMRLTGGLNEYLVYRIGDDWWLMADQGRKYLLNRFHPQDGDALVPYPFEDSVLLRSTAQPGVNTYHVLDMKDGSEVYKTRMYCMDTLLFPVQKKLFMLQVHSQLYAGAGRNRQLPAMGDWKIYSIKGPVRTSSYFFYCARKNEHETYSCLVEFKDAESRDVNIVQLDKSVCTAKWYHDFKNEILMIRDDRIRSSRSPAGWKFIDAVLVTNPSLHLSPVAFIDQDGLTFQAKDDPATKVHYITSFPINISPRKNVKWVMIELTSSRNQRRFQTWLLKYPATVNRPVTNPLTFNQPR